jgi:curli production assembly/transport component CsgG
MYLSKLIKALVILICLLQIQGCKSYLIHTNKIRKARIGEETQVLSELKSLPKPKEQIATAVYKFRDQTGQYKLSDMGGNWSTAISQGTTPILLKALEESNWFLSVERENKNKEHKSTGNQTRIQAKTPEKNKRQNQQL